MTLGSVLNTASSGLDSISRRIAVVSQNVANAGTAGYVRERVAVSSVTAGGQPMGVRTGVATRSLNERLLADAGAASAAASGGQARSAALAGIDAASGSPGSGYDLPGLLGALRDSVSTLQADPANGARQRLVVAKADALARGVNALGTAVSGARQAAQDSAVADVAAANDALHGIGALSTQIIAASARGESTADLEDQRDRSIRTLSDLTGARVMKLRDGDVLAVLGGLVLPTRSATGPFALAAATLAPNTPVPAVPALLLSGIATLPGAAGGRIGANLQLRDTELPRLQAGLDDFAQSLAARFDVAGLTLFTDAAGAVPTLPAAGLAQGVRVSAAIVAAPASVRGTGAAAGDTTLLDGLLDGVLGTGTGSLARAAADIAVRHAGLAADAAGEAATDEAVRTSLDAKLASDTAVTLDTETADMIRLQNAYGANAKVIAAAQAMWTQLLDSVR